MSTKTLVITDKPSRWDNKLYTIYTLVDLVDNRENNTTPSKFNTIVIDETITMNDLKTNEKDFNFRLFTELNKYLTGYSILIKPVSLHYDKNDEWFLIGTFRFKSNKLFQIISKNKNVDLKTFLKIRDNVIVLRHENIQPPSSDENEAKLRLAREENYKNENQRRVEIVVESIRSFKDYTEFIRNRNIFTRFVSKGIKDTDDLKRAIQESDANEYSKNLFINIQKKYEGAFFPYNEKDSLRIYYVIIVHNRILRDRLFHKNNNRQKIADTIGVFNSDKVKGCIIQSVVFTPISDYDHVQRIKIKNDDNYYIWMKAELDKLKTPNNTKMYETHLKSYNFIKNALIKPKKNTSLIGGLTRKKAGVTKTNKTRSCKSVFI